MIPLRLVPVLLLLAGCASPDSQAERVLADFDVVSALYGLSVDELNALPGVSVADYPGTVPECLDTCSSATVTVDAAPARSGPTALVGLLERLGDPVVPSPCPSAPPVPPPPPCAPVEPGGTVSCSGRFEVDGLSFHATVSGPRGTGYSLNVER